MAKWTVVYVKRNSYFNRQHDLLEEIDGRKTVVGKYNKPTAPGSLRIYKPQFKSKPSNKFLIDIDQNELNKLVNEIGLLDKEGNVITSANMKNVGDKFLSHNDLYIRFEGGSALLDDELPFDRLFLACFRADPKFQFFGEDKNPAMSALVEYKVTKAGDVEDEEAFEVAEGVSAVERLFQMTFENQVKTLNSMGVSTKKPDPERVKNLLFRKITKEADEKNPVTGESNVDLFLRLSSKGTEELALRAIINEAREYRVIGKKSGGKLIFGDLELGRNLEEVYNYLADDENVDVKNSIIKALRENGKDND